MLTSTAQNVNWQPYNLDGLIEEEPNSIANALELCLSCTNPSIWSNLFAIGFIWETIFSIPSPHPNSLSVAFKNLMLGFVFQNAIQKNSNISCIQTFGLLPELLTSSIFSCSWNVLDRNTQVIIGPFLVNRMRSFPILIEPLEKNKMKQQSFLLRWQGLSVMGSLCGWGGCSCIYIHIDGLVQDCSNSSALAMETW